MAKATYYGANFPFFGGAQRVLSRQEDDRLIKNDIKLLLLTVPGERVMRPTFGVHLRDFVFEQSDHFAIDNLASEIRIQIEENDSRVKVMNVQITPNDANNMLTVRVDVQLRRSPNRFLTIDQTVRISP